MPYYNPEIHHRKSVRLKGYDYSQPGYYFITINIDNIRCMLACWERGKLKLLPVGETAKRYWLEIPKHYPNVALDEYVIMPDHFHGIMRIIDQNDNSNGFNVGARHGVPLPVDNTHDAPLNHVSLPAARNSTASISVRFQKVFPGSVSSIINQYKGAVTRWCKKTGYASFKWQSLFYDHIIRNEKELQRIRWYIRNNPASIVKEFPGLKGNR
ncbi:MAG: hypothetical protein JW913_17730 [Chitinispirillaceae bacterium]|nr:hypothetical protein [Chitinispirillaceae bacterium]